MNREHTMRQYDTIEVHLDTQVIDFLKQYGDHHGWTFEETIRYILGNRCFIEQSSIAPIQFPGLMPQSSQSTEEWINNYYTRFATLISSLGLAKCKICLKQLSSEDIIKGECSNCGDKL